MLAASCVLRTNASKQGQRLLVLTKCPPSLLVSGRSRTLCSLATQPPLRSKTLGHNKHQARWTSTLPSNAIHPTVLPLTQTLAEKQPGFNVSAENISVLNDPVEFYELLLEMIQRAKKRIFISSLYIGSKEKELISALHTALSSNPSLELHLTLDFNRSTRPGSSPSSSTAHLLVPLLQEFPDRVHVSMFRSPHLRGLLAKIVPPRFNEGWGTWHAKVYGADGEVMLSGANLNESYFTNRKDRYIHFASQPTLAQYCFDFLRTVSTFSYQLLPPPSATASSSASLPQAVEPNQYTIHRDGYTLHWPDSSTHPHHIQKKAEHALAGFQSKQRETHSVAVDTDIRSAVNQESSKDVLLFPIIQAGQFNIREEESAFEAIFRSFLPFSPSPTASPSRPLIDLTSGYFSLYKPYQEHVLSSAADTRIVVAAPEANGFYGSKGISGRIPEGYTIKERAFVGEVKKEGKWWSGEDAGSVVEDDGGRVRLEEWRKDGWTYHAKGIWVSPNHTEDPVATLFGSTNLNARSAHIDTELSFVMVLPSQQEVVKGSPVEELRKKLGEELRRIREHASEWKGDKREVRFLTKIITWLVRGML